MWKVSETQSDTLVVVLEGRRLGTWGARSNDHIDMEVPRSCVLLPFHLRSITLGVWLGVIIMIGSLRQNFKKMNFNYFTWINYITFIHVSTFCESKVLIRFIWLCRNKWISYKGDIFSYFLIKLYVTYNFSKNYTT